MKIDLNLENYKTWYGAINIRKLDSKLQLVAMQNNINFNDYSTKELAYMFLDTKTYRALLLDILGTNKQDIIFKDSYIVNLYNDKVYYYIDKENKAIKKLCKTKKLLNRYVKKVYPDFRLD